MRTMLSGYLFISRQHFQIEPALCGNDSSKIKQIGNAIPPLLAYEFAVHLKKIIAIDDHSVTISGGLLGFELTKADAMSPALQNTTNLLLQQYTIGRKP